MHVVFVCAEYSIDGRPTGGFGTYIDHISRSLVAAGTQVTIICDGDRNRIFTSKLLTVIVLPPVGYSFAKFLHTIPFKPLTRLVRFLQYPLGFSLAVTKELLRASNESIDVIEGGDFGSELLFYLLFRKNNYPPVIIKLHTPSFMIRKYNREKNSLFYKILEKTERISLLRANSVYSPTHVLAQIVEKKIGRKISEGIPYPISGKMQKKVTKRDK